MIFYDLGDKVEAWSTNIGDEHYAANVVTPEYQAHSTKIAEIPGEIADTQGVDALITDHHGIRIGVRTADCVPILLYDNQRQAIAAIHSGWKGTVGDIISHVISRMHSQYGCLSRNMRAVIGPCIHVEAFEVGDEVYEVFSDNGYGAFTRRMSNPFDRQSLTKWHIDLPSICRAQLVRMGVPDVHVSPLCTYANHDRLHSYRRTRSADKSHRIITSIMLVD